MPFLPVNPWLKALPGVGLTAEYDGLGEFLGAGRLPAANADNMIRYVHEARRRGVSRHCIRLDRMHACIFDSACRVNLDAFYAALATPGITPEAFWDAWRPDVEPGMGAIDSEAVQDFKDILRKGLDAVTAALFIRGNLLFHTFPLSPDPKWLKAGGIPALFDAGRPLKEHERIWSILHTGTAPSQEDVLVEKRQAVEQARLSLQRLSPLEGRLPDRLFRSIVMRGGISRPLRGPSTTSAKPSMPPATRLSPRGRRSPNPRARKRGARVPCRLKAFVPEEAMRR